MVVCVVVGCFLVVADDDDDDDDDEFSPRKGSRDVFFFLANSTVLASVALYLSLNTPILAVLPLNILLLLLVA